RWLQVALFVSLAGCGSSTSTTAQIAGGSDPPFKTVPVARFDSPWALAFLPGSKTAVVTEKPGRIWLVDVGNGQKQPVAGAPRVLFGGQGGLLDIVLSPTFAADQTVYLTYSEPSANGGSGLALARARLVRATAGARLDGLQVIWRDPAGGEGGQFGGIVVFAPDGRSLFLTSGDRQRFTPAQDPSQPLGKILHLTLDGKPAPGNPWAGRVGAPAVVVTDPPEDTEAAGNAAGRRVNWPGPNLTPAETWTLGHRNPYGLAFAPDGRLWETEMGPRGGDELNLIQPGRNYGWPLVSEGKNYDGVAIPPPSARPDLEAPKLAWNPVISPTSLLIYSGNLFPAWKGSGFIGALSGEALVRVTFNGDRAQKAEQWDMGARIRFVAQGPEGALYLLEDGGRLLRLEPAAR
ncbi:MAG: aldose sugar dehydrogenase, partial [Sphingomonadales bacterium]|nr:aldose sugar dehydrogenase [Sphingomonadales bacterium]